jgi:hypothetical protein
MTTDRNDFADHTFSTLPPGYRGWALPCKDDPAAVWVWLSPEEMTGLTPEEAAHKAEFTLGDDRIFMAQHRACKDAWKHYEAAKPRAPAGSIATRLRAAADDLTFSGRPDPHDDKALLREAAAVLDSPDLRLLKDANAEWQEFGQWLVTTFQPGAVEPAAVLCPGGEYESGAAFCRRVLQMALERGAFHWASPTPLWHERQDGKRPDKSGGLAENLDACAVAVQALAIREDGKIDPETIVGTVRTLQPLLGYARIAARLLAGRGDVQLDDPLGDLVDRFGAALLAKLRKAADERGLHDHPWLKDDWHEDLVKQMYEHAHKGDPRDVAAYCAFAWHHGWSLKLRPDGFQDLVRAESLALSTYVAETFREGAVDEASVAELDLRVPLATTVLRLLKLAVSRGAFAPGQHIQTEQGPMLLMASQLRPVLVETAQNARIMAGNLIGARQYGPEVMQAALASAATLLDEIAETLEPVREDRGREMCADDFACTGDVAPGAEAVDTRFLELFYLSGPRVGLRFEGLPDLYVPDADAHAIAATLLAGGEPAAPSWKLITRAAEYFGQRIHVDGVAGKLVLTDSGTYYKAGPGRSRAELAQDIRVAVARLRALTLLPEDARRVTEVAGQLEAFAAAMSPVREDTSPDTDPSPTGQARAEFFRALQDRGADRGPTSSEPEQDPAARLLPRPA